uniref:Uncharacterized protein n=1 Tax=Nelumbo nucifera TaxID=4432 RepID=A0A822XVM3_NELNU|nr:TPA_asm: hypothetical protein HUJ06_024602 [Nelumbo nucifera]
MGVIVNSTSLWGWFFFSHSAPPFNHRVRFRLLLFLLKKKEKKWAMIKEEKKNGSNSSIIKASKLLPH